MISSLQPSRPKVPPSNSSPPLNQQPTRTFTSTPGPPTFQYLPPRNQIEAMPPTVPLPTTLVLGHPQQQFQSAMRHPVFFTDRFKKAPPGVNSGNGSWSTPVAEGYVYNDGVRKGVDGSARL
ncbi:uncharacterized protein LY89DRAFT_743368 [Mollisia scopiformis]|uniref:Uncharacterized protein n=1 Tax=Mollisia scopiformis TaxID=149040 RepID=A0A132B3R1_MOLSC|nr:uncharacterized protein LY89DRAFT_743368 [Mollisia scopiformis]KUJ07045.1 hypothetical protein LY89DRAFT_743368 [Mollisia scopiformis]